MQDPAFGDAVDVLEGRGVVEVDIQGVFLGEVHDGFDGLLIFGRIKKERSLVFVLAMTLVAISSGHSHRWSS